MNHRLLAAATVGLAVISLSGSVDAQTQEASQPGDNEFSVEAQGSTYKYEEPGVMQLKGVKGGVAGRVTHRAEAQVFVAGEARFAYGKVDYTSVKSGSENDELDYLYEYRGLAGKRFGDAGASASPYLGLGWRHLVNDSSGRVTSTGDYGYLRVSDYYYLPLGVDLRFQLGGGSYIEANAEYDLLVRGRQQSDFSDFCGKIIKQTQNKGHGFRGSIMVGAGAWAVGPFFARWRIEDSNVEGPCGIDPDTGLPAFWVEPKNNTTEAGVRLRYSFQ